jgi:hypothetical protein
MEKNGMKGNKPKGKEKETKTHMSFMGRSPKLRPLSSGVMVRYICC